MARIEREHIERRSILPPKYNAREHYEYELNRFIRKAKYIIVGGVIGFGLGLTLGIPWAVRLTEQIAHPASFSVAASLSLAGIVVGVVAGYIAENLTAPSLPKS